MSIVTLKIIDRNLELNKRLKLIKYNIQVLDGFAQNPKKNLFSYRTLLKIHRLNRYYKRLLELENEVQTRILIIEQMTDADNDKCKCLDCNNSQENKNGLCFHCLKSKYYNIKVD